jgi:hypothetical protein
MLQELAKSKKLRKQSSRLLKSAKFQKYAGAASAIGLSLPALYEQNA